MSSILKALEKVEQSQNARRPGGPSSLPKSRQRRPAWVLPVGVIGGAAVASLLTFAAMGGFKKPAATTAQPQPGPAVGIEAAAVQPAPTAAALQPKQTPAVAQKTPAVAQKTPAVAQKAAAVAPPKSVPGPAAKVTAATTAPNAAKHTAAAKATSAAAAQGAKKSAKVPAPVKSASAAKVVAKKVEPHRSNAAKEVAAAHTAPAQPAPVRQAAPAAAPVQVAQTKSRPELRVTGIAWQNDSQSSAAIVNGHMLSHGGTVDGYKIEQIFEDKVRFSGKNGTIEVPLSAGE